VKFSILPNDDLQLAIDSPADKTLVEELLKKNACNDIAFMAELLEDTGLSPNGRLYLVAPEHIAALTDAPILTNEMLIEDDGEVLVTGKVWWYPDYAVQHFGEELHKQGSVNFKPATFGS
jgi:hypothetical protein